MWNCSICGKKASTYQKRLGCEKTHNGCTHKWEYGLLGAGVSRICLICTHRESKPFKLSQEVLKSLW